MGQGNLLSQLNNWRSEIITLRRVWVTFGEQLRIFTSTEVVLPTAQTMGALVALSTSILITPISTPCLFASN